MKRWLIPLIAAAASAVLAASPTYTKDIAPIVLQKCAPCHFAGGPGPFPLTSFAAVKEHARQIAIVTRSRYMPPWLPSPQAAAFADELRLSQEQIDTISKWVAAGSPEGEQAASSVTPISADGWKLGPPDLLLQPKEALRVPPEGTDVFWNFVLTPNLKERRYVRAIDIRPTNPKIVHHANLILDRTGGLRAREVSVGSGFPGMDVTVLRSPLDLDGHFLFWKPGSIPWTEPDGLAWVLYPGNDLVLNVHLQPSGKAEWERPQVALYFTDKPPTQFPYLLQLEHDGNLDIPAGDHDFVVTDELRLPVATKVLGVYPHAHYLGTLLEGWATLPDGAQVSLVRITHWDPNWQAVYRYKAPLHLPAGTVLHMRYHYDNSAANPRNPNQPPKRVQGGNQATDEMGHLWLEVLPEQGRDARRLYAETWARHQLEKYPASYDADVTLGALALARLHAPEAVAPLAQATKLKPKDSVAHNLYGSALEATGQTTDAIAQFRAAIDCDPANANARFNLAHALARSGDSARAIATLREILKRTPHDPAAQEFLQQLTR